MAEKVKATQAQIDEALALLERTKAQRAKQREKMKNDPAAKAKAQERALRLRVKNSLLTKKALAAGITVSEAEIATAVKALQAK